MDKKTMLFWLGCMPARLALALNIEKLSPTLQLATIIPGIVWLTGMYKSSIGFFGGYAWWAQLRPLHGALWVLYAATKDKRWLLLDTSLAAWARVVVAG